MRQRVRQQPRELAEPQRGPAKGPAARATVGPFEPSADPVQPSQALALQPLLGNGAVAQLLAPAVSPPGIQRLATTVDSLGDTGTLGKGKALIGESNYVKIKKELGKYYKASKPPERTKHLNKILGLVDAWMKQNADGKSKGNSMRKTRLEMLRFEIQQELADLAKPPARPTTPAHVAAGIAGPPPKAGAAPAPAKPTRPTTPAPGVAAAPPARPKSPTPTPDRFMVNRPKPQKPARPATPAPAVAGKAPPRPTTPAHVAAGIAGPPPTAAAAKGPARPKTATPAKPGTAKAPGGAPAAAAKRPARPKTAAPPKHASALLGGVYGPRPNVGLNAAFDKVIATTDEGTIDPEFRERFSDIDVAAPFVERFSDADVASTPAPVATPTPVATPPAAAPTTTVAPPAPAPAPVVFARGAPAATPDIAAPAAAPTPVAAAPKPAPAPAPAAAMAAAPDLGSVGDEVMRLVQAAVSTIAVAEKVSFLEQLDGPLLQLETLLSDPVLLQSADPALLQELLRYAAWARPEVDNLPLMREEAEYWQDIQAGKFNYLTAEGKSKAVDPMAKLAAGDLGKGQWVQAANQDLVDTMRAHGISEAEMAAIKLYTAPEYRYMNPALEQNPAVAENRVREKKKDEHGADVEDPLWIENALKLNESKGAHATEHQLLGAALEPGEFGPLSPADTAAAEGQRHGKFAVEGLRKLPSVRATAYRGMALKPEDYKRQFVDATVWQTKGFTSTSTDRDTAFKFASEEKSRIGKHAVEIVLEIDVIDGKNVQPFSVHKTENEVLLLPGTRGTIGDSTDLNVGLKAANTDRTIKIIQIQQMPT